MFVVSTENPPILSTIRGVERHRQPNGDAVRKFSVKAPKLYHILILIKLDFLFSDKHIFKKLDSLTRFWETSKYRYIYITVTLLAYIISGMFFSSL